MAMSPKFTPTPPPTTAATTTHIFRSKLPDITIPNHLPLHSYCFEKLSVFSTTPVWLWPPLENPIPIPKHTSSPKKPPAFSKLGINKGDVIMILLLNSPEFVFSYMGSSMIGAVANAGNPHYTAAEISKQLKASGAKLVVTYSHCVDKVRDSGEDVAVVTVGEAAENCVSFSIVYNADEKDAPAVEIDSNDAVSLPFSSGTAGLRKGMVLTHKSMVSSMAQQVV